MNHGIERLRVTTFFELCRSGNEHSGCTYHDIADFVDMRNIKNFLETNIQITSRELQALVKHKLTIWSKLIMTQQIGQAPILIIIRNRVFNLSNKFLEYNFLIAVGLNSYG